MNTAAAFQPENFSVPEAARHLRVSESFIWKLIREKRLKAFRIGARTIVARSAVDELMSASAAQR